MLFYNKKFISLFLARTWQHFIDLLKRKNPRFTAFLDSNLHTRLAIVTKNELCLAFPPRNLPKKFRPDPSTLYFVIVVINRQTDGQTNAGKNIIPRFRGDKYFSVVNGLQPREPALCQLYRHTV